VPCDTCPFVFERLVGANTKVSPQGLAETLRNGLVELEEPLLETLGDVVPAGDYSANLLELVPELVRPGEPRDYFSHEQLDVWGVDPFSGLPPNPGTEYYRGTSARLDGRAELFEFVVPMYPRRWLDDETVAAWARRLEDGARPTALALAVLDVREPHDASADLAVTRHYCLASLLLDGHHRLFAAAEAGRPITILSFLTYDASVADEEDVDAALAALAAY
jgi:hypothetical protein